MDRHSSYSAPRSERASGSYGGNRGRSTKRNTYNKRSWNDNRKLHTLVFYILPFILINLVIFIVATSKPKIEYDVSDTRDYRSVDISIHDYRTAAAGPLPASQFQAHKMKPVPQCVGQGFRLGHIPPVVSHGYLIFPAVHRKRDELLKLFFHSCLLYFYVFLLVYHLF